MISIFLILSVMQGDVITHEFLHDMKGKDISSCHRMGTNTSKELTEIFKSYKMTVKYDCKERKRV